MDTTRTTLHIPLELNSGEPVPARALERIERDILAAAGGFTRTEAIGAWIDDSDPDNPVLYHESMALYSVDHATDGNVASRLHATADMARIALAQHAVYVTSQDITAHLVPAPSAVGGYERQAQLERIL